MKSEILINKVDVVDKVDKVDKVDIEIILIANILLYINITMSTLYKYIYFNRWT